MARLTKEELGGMRLLVRDKRASGFVYVSVHHEHITSALDELEEHRAREGTGVWLNEEAVEKIRKAIVFDHIGGNAPLIVDALALLPPKREPISVAECAKKLLGMLGADGFLASIGRSSMDEWRGHIAALRAAIERESKR